MHLPKEIQNILSTLKKAGFDGYAVGGCVRDTLLKRTPGDWDITTNALPEKLQELFPENYYENVYGTVTVKTGLEAKTLAEVQITPYRTEAKYSDKRHPDEIRFAKTLEEDLGRRDFTVNAMAMDIGEEIIDLFKGREDIKNKLIRAVGKPEDRFDEDALRILRAVRFATTLNFKIEEETHKAITKNSKGLRGISGERIRDEFVKIIESPHATNGIELMRATEILQYVLPELLEGVDVQQNLHHIYTVWEHNIRALEYTVKKNYSTEIRLASLLHDVGKPRTKRGKGRNSTFYGHEVVGARMARSILKHLRFSREFTDKITTLVRYHLFYYNVGEVTESSVRRLMANVGKENMEDLLKVREADRIGSGTPKAVPYKLRHMKFMIDKVSRDPISPKMLKINGNEMMKLLKIKPSPRIGILINALMGDVLDDPTKNDKKYLEKRTQELNVLENKELIEIAKGGKVKTASEEEKEILKIKKKHYVE